MRDEFDDFIDEIKKHFNLNTDIFDKDFLFLPESDFNLEKKLDNKKVKGFKISYHFETGMDKPEIKIEGNIDNKKIREFLKNTDLTKYPKLKDMFNLKSNKEIDASKLSLDYNEEDKDVYFLEPCTEIYDNKDFTEIVLEIPGMDKDDVNISFSDDGTKLTFNAENKNRKYIKSLQLPFKSSNEYYELEVNNGIAILKVSKAII